MESEHNTAIGSRRKSTMSSGAKMKCGGMLSDEGLNVLFVCRS